ncbi:ocs element-binding factor 1 [Panicum miliaceum]|uniref:Ocs element-binding factor 1 n=1 Tax=Panicum miliaceum TaxID=4540 RepID=A0A3L6PF73_PANMI|nr:ocs element-binding factor 1 [Panicum miliaceum]
MAAWLSAPPRHCVLASTSVEQENTVLGAHTGEHGGQLLFVNKVLRFIEHRLDIQMDTPASDPQLKLWQLPYPTAVNPMEPAAALPRLDDGGVLFGFALKPDAAINSVVQSTFATNFTRTSHEAAGNLNFIFENSTRGYLWSTKIRKMVVQE